MATPRSTVERFDLSIRYSVFSLKKNREGFRGLQLFPALGVMHYAAKFLKIDIKSLLGKVEETKRAPKGAYPRDTFTWTEDSYSLEDHGAEEPLDDEDLERYSDILRAERLASIRATNRVWMRLEYDIKTLIEAWGNSTAVANPWTSANAKPIDHIQDALDAVQDRTGCKPNVISMGDRKWTDLKRHDQFINLIDNGSNDRPAQLSRQGFKEYFELDELVITSAYQNTQQENETADASLGRLWDPTKVFIGIVTDDGMDGDLEDTTPCVGRTIFKEDEVPDEFTFGDNASPEPSIIMEEYEEPKTRGKVMRARNHRYVKKLHEDAGQLLTGC